VTGDMITLEGVS